jgi:uncharacterized repeat protein (TIGR03803 family)
MKTRLKKLCLPLGLITGLSLIMPTRVTAQTFTTLHPFTGGSGGASPQAGLTISGNTLYGTAADAGNVNYLTPGGGTVFKVNTDGTGFTNIYTFALPVVGINSDGANPAANLILSGATLYGTAADGGSYGAGTVFRVNTAGADFTNLYTFTNGSDGSGLIGGLSLSGNTLYGAAAGGSGRYGSVFAVNTDGTGFTNLYRLTGGQYAVNSAGLILSGNTLYGTIFSYPNSTLFKVNTDGTGFTNIYSVPNGGSYGSRVIAGLILSGNTLYGTAEYGGSAGWGAVFAVNTDGSGYTNLYSFPADGGYNAFGYYANSEGVYPVGLVLSSNTLYVTTYEGGSFGYGAVFSVNTNGTIFTNLYSFNYSGGGDSMSAGPIISGNTLYGTATDGGLYDNGTVFSLTLGTIPLGVTTTALPDGTNGMAYSQTLAASGGQTPYSWKTNSGALPKGLTLATNGILAGTPASNGTFNFSVKVTDALSVTATQALVLQVDILDTNKPTLSITNVTAGMSVSNAAFTVKGTAKDNVAVSNVFYSLNNAGWNPAVPGNHWTNWSADVTLIPGTNTVAAYAVDTSGNVSLTNKVAFKFIPSATLVVRTNGHGTFTPKDNGALLVINTNYTLTASAGPNWLFSNWVASGSENFVSNNPVLKFRMQPNLVLQANFVTNGFLAAQGTYHGLFAPTNASRQQTNSGAITLTVTSAGVLSGKLTLGTNTPSLTGQFNPAGAATIITPRKGESNLITTLQLDFAGQTVAGSVTDGSFVAQVIADLDVFNSTHKATNYEGSYTFIIAGTDLPTVGPLGTSYGTVTVSPLGAVTFTVSLADGTASPLNPSSVVSKDGYWPFYLPLDSGNGSLWSWNCFTNGAIMSATNASWINATNSTKTALYRVGFTNEAASIFGSAFNPTHKPLLALTNGQVILAGGNLPFAITNQITLASNNTIALTNAADTNKLVLTINKTTGVISGTFANPSSPKQTVNVSGVLLQNQTNAAGYFLGANQSGTFSLALPNP